jgi:VWFA-related protein
LPKLRILGSRRFTSISVLSAAFILPCASLPAQAQAKGENSTAAAQNPTPVTTLKTASNLVVVRVVVRDEQGKPIENLKKKDFRVFDRGKEQTISQFDVETSAAAVASSAVHPLTPNSSPLPAVEPERFLALYFDDLNSSDSDMIQARDAADHYLSSNLQARDRVAIFTSGQVLSDFTSDPKQLHEALLKLRANPQAHYCPDLSDYQALQITQNNQEALDVANDEVKHCAGGVLVGPAGAPSGGRGSGLMNSSASPEGGSGGGIAQVVVQTLAQNIVNQAEMQARANLQQLERVVAYISPKSGEHIVVLVSPGFLSQSEQYQLDRLIDHALRSQVVISALDPKGLAILVREADSSVSYIPATNPGVLQAARRVDSDRELAASAVLANVAEGTGGEFFHNSNDLKGGFSALTGSPVYYILAFSPSDLKPDGKFHPLKVTLSEKRKSLSVRARRGYFASKNEPDVAQHPKQAQGEKELTVSDTQAAAQENIRRAVLSTTDSQELPVTLSVKAPAGQGEIRELSVFAHLDAAALHFRKDGDHDLNTVTFVFAVFDQTNNLVNAQQRQVRVNVLDAQLPNFIKSGVDVSAMFQLKPGTYRLREVVVDSEDHHLTALSRSIQIP